MISQESSNKPEKIWDPRRIKSREIQDCLNITIPETSTHNANQRSLIRRYAVPVGHSPVLAFWKTECVSILKDKLRRRFLHKIWWTAILKTLDVLVDTSFQLSTSLSPKVWPQTSVSDTRTRNRSATSAVTTQKNTDTKSITANQAVWKSSQRQMKFRRRSTIMVLWWLA